MVFLLSWVNPRSVPEILVITPQEAEEPMQVILIGHTAMRIPSALVRPVFLSLMVIPTAFTERHGLAAHPLAELFEGFLVQDLLKETPAVATGTVWLGEGFLVIGLHTTFSLVRRRS